MLMPAKNRGGTFVTPARWHERLQHDRYGETTTYQLAAAWLQDCATIADWGAGAGHFRTYLPVERSPRYLPIDGTFQVGPGEAQVLADLATYHEPSDGILLRHVLEHVDDWTLVLTNALTACRRRMVLVTFTPDVIQTTVVKRKSGWPVRHFNPDDLRRTMGSLLVRDECVQTSHPERVYYLERPCAS